MSNKQRAQANTNTGSKAQSSKQLAQDAAMRKQAANFPGVGITLGSYKHNPFNISKDSKRGASGPGNRFAPPVAAKLGKWRRFRRVVTVKRTILVLLILALGTGGWLGSKFLYNAHKIFGGNILSVLQTTKLKGEDSGRVNILLAGNSADDPGHNGANLTDSILLMSIDTKNNKAFLLSIPRDLYVQVGDSGHTKINAAYPDGVSSNFNQDGYPAGGMGQLEQVVATDFGIPIDYYALIDYDALRDAVNAVGGITVNINSSDPRGLYDPSIDYDDNNAPLVKLTNGPHTLNGAQALGLARARGDNYYSYGFAASDFQRTADQREELIALKTKAVTAGVLANPTKLSSLADAIGSNVHTDLKLSEVHRLYDLTKNLSDIQSLSLNTANGKNLLMSYTTYEGESALIPAAGLDNFNDIQTYMNQITSTDPVVQEGATIYVLNATSTAGLATQQEKKLTTKNYNVLGVGNATDQPTTSIIQTTAGKDPATAAALIKLYGNHLTTVNPYAGTYTADYIIVLGADQAPAAATTPATSTGAAAGTTQ